MDQDPRELREQRWMIRSMLCKRGAEHSAGYLIEEDNGDQWLIPAAPNIFSHLPELRKNDTLVYSLAVPRIQQGKKYSPKSVISKRDLSRPSSVQR